jgi:rhodanese-related sulfurtransferase
VVNYTTSSGPFEIILAAANKFATSGKSTILNSQTLNATMKNHDPADNCFVLCVDTADTYAKGHINASVNIPWADLFKTENLKKLPTDQQIVVYSQDGNFGNQATAILNCLGYNASSLEWGVASWTLDDSLASSRYNQANDCKNYPTVTGTLPSIYAPIYY